MLREKPCLQLLIVILFHYVNTVQSWLCFHVDVHGITTGDNWKVFARALGFSYQDIRTRLGRAPDPFSEIVAMYRRQGHDYDEFMLVLNQVARKLRLHDDSSEESPVPTPGGQQGWKQMMLGGIGNWFSGGGGGGVSGGNRTPSQSGSSTPRSVHEEEESQREYFIMPNSNLSVRKRMSQRHVFEAINLNLAMMYSCLLSLLSVVYISCALAPLL